MEVTWVFWFAMVVCLCIGSFMNVVIHRLPLIINDAWESSTVEGGYTTYSLAWPGSECPKCHHALAWYDNIPVLSWLMLRGRCRYCGEGISARYIGIEVLSVIWGMFAWFGSLSLWSFGSWYLFGILLLALAFIDFETFSVPDELTYPLLWVGVVASLNGWSLVSINESIYGVLAGYLSLSGLAKCFEWATGKEAMGHGDFKLYGALGGWLGIYALPMVLVVACAFTLILAFMYRAGPNKPLPFVPGLCFSGLLLVLSQKMGGVVAALQHSGIVEWFL